MPYGGMTVAEINLPTGVLLPSDVAAASALIKEVLEMARAEESATRFLEELQMDAQATPVDFAI